jgi:hypothetical protein
MHSTWLRTCFMVAVAVTILINFSSSAFAGSCLSCPSVYSHCVKNCGRPLRPANWRCLAACK